MRHVLQGLDHAIMQCCMRRLQLRCPSFGKRFCRTGHREEAISSVMAWKREVQRKACLHAGYWQIFLQS